MKAAVFNFKINKLEIVNLEIPEPNENQVRLKVLACGVCGTDKMIPYLIDNNIQRVPGHEIIGLIDKIGNNVDIKYKIGMKVGCGWIAKTCGKCNSCISGNNVNCKYQLNCGKNFDGGFAEYCIIPEEGLIIIPDGMDPIETSPLICAGNTVFNALRYQNIKQGSLVGIHGIGGLGHLGIQYFKKMGYKVIAFSSGNNKRSLSMELGAHHYINMSDKDFVDQVHKIGPLKCIISTSQDDSQMIDLLKCLDSSGKLVMTGFCKDFKINVFDIIANSLTITGCVCGDSNDCLDSLEFAKLNNIKSQIQIITLDQIPNMLENLNNARFRYVVSFINN